MLKQLRCFAFTQNSPLSAVHGRTADNAGSRFRLILLTRFLFIQDFLAFCVNLLPAPLSRRIRVPHFPAIKNISSYFCLEPRTSLSVLKSLSPLAFLQRDGTDTRRRVNNTRRHAKECTSVFILWLRVRQCELDSAWNHARPWAF